MTNRSSSLIALSAAALVVACASNPPASSAPEVVPVATAEVQATPADTNLTDARAMELGRKYAAMFHGRSFDSLWTYATPASKERFGSVERFRTGGEQALTQIGAETGIVSETVEPASAGMTASKAYVRVSNYAGSQGTPVRLVIGLMNDGTIAGMQIRPVE